MKLGYNTNGLAFHRWQDALALLADVGYSSAAITVDHHCLDPRSPNHAAEVAEMGALLDRLGMISVVETGARFLLDPRVKHEPTLLSARADDRRVRVEFLERCIDVARALGSEAVSFWSGVERNSGPPEESLARLAEGCREVADYASRRNVRLAFEPEPGMFIETLEQYGRLADMVGATHFGLTIDVGHVHCVEEGQIAVHLRRWADRLLNVHIEDMRRGVHEHLRFGEGEIDFAPVLSALEEIGYKGGVNVELSRHSHMAPEAARESYEFLQSLLVRLGLAGN
jgi:sugar phosphate isomerase/epimerase